MGIKLSAPSADLFARDTANRNRANHTGTQPWNTITGTPTTTAGYGITDAAFNGQIINGVAHFVQNTAPTTRINEAGQNIGALVAGDRWYNRDTGISGFWRSPYWLSLRRFATLNNFVSGSTTLYAPFHRDYSTQADGALSSGIFYIHSLNSVVRASPVDASNYWTITGGIHTPNGTPTWTSSTITYNSAVIYQKNTLLQNTAIFATHVNQASINATKVGSPGNLILSLHLSYSEVL